MSWVDLNADLGEGSGDDAGLLGVVTTAHVACGGHTGDKETMARTLQAAAAAGVAVGAHPSYPDREGFGRRAMNLPVASVVDAVADQVRALASVASGLGLELRSVKPHGALYHRLADDEELALAVAAAVGTAVAGSDPRGSIFVLPAGARTAGPLRRAGTRVVTEAFCDRGYLNDGRLVDRGDTGAVITDPRTAASRARSIALDGVVPSVDGSRLMVDARTLCVHGDTPGALAIAAAVRDALTEAGVTVRPIDSGVGG